jgi:hypothetical protein
VAQPGCEVAQQGAAWLSRVRHGSVMVRRGSAVFERPCSNLGSAPQGGSPSPTEPTAMKKMETGLSDQRMFVNDCMNAVCKTK